MVGQGGVEMCFNVLSVFDVIEMFSSATLSVACVIASVLRSHTMCVCIGIH